MRDNRTFYRLAIGMTAVCLLIAVPFLVTGFLRITGIFLILSAVFALASGHFRMRLQIQGLEKRISGDLGEELAKLQVALRNTEEHTPKLADITHIIDTKLNISEAQDASIARLDALLKEVHASEAVIISELGQLHRAIECARSSIEEHASTTFDAKHSQLAEVVVSSRAILQSAVRSALAGAGHDLSKLISELNSSLADSRQHLDSELTTVRLTVSERLSEGQAVHRGLLSEFLNSVAASHANLHDAIDQLVSTVATSTETLDSRAISLREQLLATIGPLQTDVRHAFDQISAGMEHQEQLCSELIPLLTKGLSDGRGLFSDLSELLSSLKPTLGELLRTSALETHEALRDIFSSIESTVTASAAAILEAERVHFNALQNKSTELRSLNEGLPETLGAYLDLRQRLSHSGSSLPALGGWAITAPVIVEIVYSILNSSGPPTVVELGSGSSSVWIGLALRERGSGHCWSVESDSDYAERTRELLKHHGVDEWVTVLDAPLSNWSGDQRLTWYDFSSVRLPAGEIDILLVDGPVATGGGDRYPAVPFFQDQLAHGALVILDDTIRVRERQIFKSWQDELRSSGYRLTMNRDTGKSWIGTFLKH